MGAWQAFEQGLQARFFERERVIHGLMVSLVAGQNVFLLGSPGTGKSALARALCKGVGGRYFETLVTQSSSPETILGPVSVKALTEEDTYRHNVTGMLPDSDIGFVDEIWKANSALLNEMLPIINERVVHNHPVPGQHLTVPLRMLVAASNELPNGDDQLEAMWDRFAMRFEVKPLKHGSNFLQMLTAGGPKTALQGPSLNEVDAASSLVDDVKWAGIEETFLKLWDLAPKWGVYVSDRRWKQCLRLVKANAVLAGRTEVEPSDLLILADALWQEPDQQVKVRQSLLGVVDPALGQAEELVDASEEQWRTAMTIDGEAQDVAAKVSEAAAKLKKSVMRLQELVDIQRGRGRDTSAISGMLARVEGWNKDLHNKLVSRYMGGAAS